MSVKEQILPDDTSATLHDRLSVLGSELLIKTLKAIETNVASIPQDHTKATYAPLLKKKEGHIDWKMPAENLDAFIRGMSPWPGAFTFHGNKLLKIFKASPEAIDSNENPGTVVKRFSDELIVATGKGALSIMEIQGASGKRLLIQDFLRGNKILPGTVLT
jgi:methionyl-tRNA formyltransferase